MRGCCCRPVAVSFVILRLLMSYEGLHSLDRCIAGDFEMLAGNLASIGVGGIVAVVTSLVVCKFRRRQIAICTMLYSSHYTYCLS